MYVSVYLSNKLTVSLNGGNQPLASENGISVNDVLNTGDSNDI